MEEVALRVRACNGHLAVLDGDVLVRAACPDCVITNVAIDVARKGEGCIFQRQRAIRKDSIGIEKGGGAGNGQHIIRQVGIDAAGNAFLRILAQREVCIVQGQGVGIRVIGHGAVTQHIALVGLCDLLACYPEVVGFAFRLVRVHIRQFQIVLVLSYGSRKVLIIFLHVDFRIRSILVGAIPEPAYVISDAQSPLDDVIAVTVFRHNHKQMAAVVCQKTILPDVPIRMDLQLAARVHGSEIGDAVGCSLEHCPCDVHCAIDPDVSSADARMKIFQRDFGPGCDRCSCVSAQNSVRLSIQIGTQIGIGEIVFSPGDLFCFLNAVAFRSARHLAVCHQPQIFFTEGFDQRDRPQIRNSNCGQRHVSVKGQKAMVIGYLTLNATHILTIDPSDILRIQKHTCHTASCSDRRAARQCQRGREVQREGCGKHPGEEFLPSSFHCKSLLFSTNFVAGKKLHGSLLGYRGALVFAINPGLVFG